MKNSGKTTFLKTTFRGLLIILPIIGAVYLFNNLFSFFKKNINKIMETIGLETHFQAWIVLILTLSLVLLILYVIGLASRTQPLVKLSKWLDQQLLENIEFYRTIKLNLDNSLQFLLEDRPAIFVTFGASERPGFLMEKANSEGKCVVFIPKNFNTFNGNIYIVKQEHIRFAKSSSSDLIFAISHLGAEMDIR